MEASEQNERERKLAALRNLTNGQLLATFEQIKSTAKALDLPNVSMPAGKHELARILMEMLEKLP